MLASDLMNQKVIYVHPQDKIRAAVKKMIENDVSGLPVVNGDMKLLGLVTETDILNYGKLGNKSDYLGLLEVMLYRQTPDTFKEEILETLNEDVANVMSESVITVGTDTPVGEIVMIMSEKDINRVFVLEEGIVQGVISRKDIMVKIFDFI